MSFIGDYVRPIGVQQRRPFIEMVMVNCKKIMFFNEMAMDSKLENDLEPLPTFSCGFILYFFYELHCRCIGVSRTTTMGTICLRSYAHHVF